MEHTCRRGQWWRRWCKTWVIRRWWRWLIFLLIILWWNRRWCCLCRDNILHVSCLLLPHINVSVHVIQKLHSRSQDIAELLRRAGITLRLQNRAAFLPKWVAKYNPYVIIFWYDDSVARCKGCYVPVWQIVSGFCKSCCMQGHRWRLNNTTEA